MVHLEEGLALKSPPSKCSLPLRTGASEEVQPREALGLTLGPWMVEWGALQVNGGPPGRRAVTAEYIDQRIQINFLLTNVVLRR